MENIKDLNGLFECDNHRNSIDSYKCNYCGRVVTIESVTFTEKPPLSYQEFIRRSKSVPAVPFTQSSALSPSRFSALPQARKTHTRSIALRPEDIADLQIAPSKLSSIKEVEVPEHKAKQSDVSIKMPLGTFEVIKKEPCYMKHKLMIVIFIASVLFIKIMCERENV